MTLEKKEKEIIIKIKNIYLILFSFFIVTNLFCTKEWIPINGSNPEKPELTIITSNENETIIEVNLKGFYKEDVIIEDVTYNKISFPGYGKTVEEGKPALPTITEFIGIPIDKNVKISVIDSTLITLENYYVYPFQGFHEMGEESEFIIDSTFYNSNQFFPNLSTSISQPMIWRDIRNISKTLLPIRIIQPHKSSIFYLISPLKLIITEIVK